jgi:hypothetical protein
MNQTLMDNPLLQLFLFTGIGVIIGMISVAFAFFRLLKSKPTDLSALLFSAVIYFFPLMSKPIYAFILTIVSQTQPSLTGDFFMVAGILFGLVAATQGLLGVAFMRPLAKTTHADALLKLPMRLAIMGVIETVATMTMIFTIILSNANAQ